MLPETPSYNPVKSVCFQAGSHIKAMLQVHKVSDLPQGQLGPGPEPFRSRGPEILRKTMKVQLFIILNKFRQWFCTENTHLNPTTSGGFAPLIPTWATPSGPLNGHLDPHTVRLAHVARFDFDTGILNFSSAQGPGKFGTGCTCGSASLLHVIVYTLIVCK